MNNKNLVALSLFGLASVVCFTHAQAQLGGTKTIPGDYASIALAISDLNTQGVAAGGVQFNVAAGYTETIVSTLSITATGTATSPIVFKKNGSGSNPVITSYISGLGTPSSAVQDGIWNLVGADYVTIDGINLSENAANTSNPSTMEYGYALFKASGTNGCQHDTIRNCVITLDRINNDLGSASSANGSAGIIMLNTTASNTATSLTITDANGSSSFNAFQNNTIQNCNTGIALMGYADVSPYTYADRDNVVGSILAGNTIINFGGGGSNPCAGIRTLQQKDINISFNTIDNNDGNGVNHAGEIRCIQLGICPGANSTVTYNILSFKGGGTTQTIYGIDNSSGGTANGNTNNMSHNVISNSSYSTATSGAINCILNSGSASNLIMDDNLITGISTAATSSNQFMLYNLGTIVDSASFNNNVIDEISFTAAATSAIFRGINYPASAATCKLDISNNSFEDIVFQGTGSGQATFIQNAIPTLSQNITGNVFTNITLNTSGSVYLINSNNIIPAGGIRIVDNNTIQGSFSKTLAGGTVYGYYSYDYSNSNSIEYNRNNNFSNINVVGNTSVLLWYSNDGNTAYPYGAKKIISGNTFENIGGGSGNVFGLIIGYSCDTCENLVYNNTISNLSSTGGVVLGIRFERAGHNIYNNTVHGLYTAGANSYVNGIIYGGVSTTAKIHHNKIYDIEESASSANTVGISITGGGTNLYIYDNLIGDLRAPNAAGGTSVRGISIVGTFTNNYLYHNTVHINATSVGTNFGSCILSLNPTGVNFDVRNNIFINKSTPTGSGKSIIFFRQLTTSMTEYASTSDNNLFYAGIPSVNNVMYYDGSNSAQSLSDFQTYLGNNGRDSLSVTEDVDFLSVDGDSANFLHIDYYTPTLVSNGGQYISGYALDVDDDIRQGNVGYTGNGTAPDIGADEFEVGCTAIDTAIISSNDIVLCDGDNITFTASNFSSNFDITYQWKIGTAPGGPYFTISGATDTIYTSDPLSGGPYYFVFETTCPNGPITTLSNEDTVEVTPASFVDLGSDIVSSNPTVTLDADNAGSNYLWNNNQTSQTIDVTSNGSYSVTVTTVNGCVDSDTINVTITASIIEAGENNMSLSLFPNPTSGNFNISIVDLYTEQLKIDLLDVNGKVIYQEIIQHPATTFTHPIEISYQNAGIYFVRVTADEQNYVIRIVKN